MNEQMEDLVLLFLQGDLDEAGARTLLAEFDRSPDLRDQAVRMYRMQIFLQRLGRHDALEQAVWRSLDSMSRFPSARRQMIEENVVGRLEQPVGTAMISGSKTTSEHNRQPKGSSPSTIPFTRRWAFWTSIAAGILTMLGMYWVNTTRVRPAAVPAAIEVAMPVAKAEGRLTEIGGEVWVARTDGTGEPSAASVGTEVFVGEAILTGTNATAQFAYADGSTLQLYRNSAVVLSRTDAGPELDLRVGAIDADIRKQQDGRHLRILGELMHAEIVGTEFRLLADSQSRWLGVRKGVVEVSRVADGRKLKVQAEEYAAVAQDIPYWHINARTCSRWEAACLRMAGTPYP